MAERVQEATKKLEDKRENKALQTQKTGPSQSISSSAEQILFLQRTIGNQAVGRLLKSGALQAKLRIGQPGDIYEQEADRMAERVMRMPEMPFSKGTISNHDDGTPIRRKCPGCNKEIKIRKEDEKEKLQKTEVSGSTPEVSSELESSISAVRSGGQPLPEFVRAFFELRFGTDFDQVRVHSDVKAAEVARVVDARAFTMGRNVVFGEGEYTPETISGRRLLAHELTHTIQQGADIRDKLEKDHSGNLLRQNIKMASKAIMKWQRLTATPQESVQVARQTPDVGIIDPNNYRQLECVKRLGGCPETRSGGIPTPDEILRYNKQCWHETHYTGPDVALTSEECRQKIIPSGSAPAKNKTEAEESEKNSRKSESEVSKEMKAAPSVKTEPKGEKVNEDLKRKIAAIALAESYTGQEEYIRWIYYNQWKSLEEQGLNRSVAYRNKGMWYKIWIIALGDKTFANDEGTSGDPKKYKSLSEYVEKHGWFREFGQKRADKMKTLIDEVFENPDKNPFKKWLGQGNLDDFNRDDNKWRKARQYFYLQKENKVKNILVKELSADKVEDYSFIFDENKIDDFFNNNPDKLPDKIVKYEPKK